MVPAPQNARGGSSALAALSHGSQAAAGRRALRGIRLGLVGALACCLLGGPAARAGANRVSRAESDVQQGPVRVQLSVTPSEVNLAAVLTLSLRIESEEGVSVEPPRLDGILEGFALNQVQQPVLRWENRRRVWQQVYRLEPVRLGKRLLPPLAISFRDTRRGGVPPQVVQTEPLELTIGTAIRPGEVTLGRLHNLAGTVEIPPEEPSTTAWLLGSASCLSAAGLLVWRRVAKRRRTAQTPSPQEFAHHELSLILHEDLAERDVKQFYVELCGVLHRYLQRSLRLESPELTTEDLLEAVAAAPTISAEQGQELQLFLASADRVKFAAFQPSSEDVEEVLLRARRFLGLDAGEVAR